MDISGTSYISKRLSPNISMWQANHWLKVKFQHIANVPGVCRFLEMIPA